MKILQRFKEIKLFSLLFGLLFAAYAWAFWKSLNGRWFSTDWVTDDSLQQLFPFYSVFHPEIFSGDLITRMMECYLAPLHYWISYAVTWLTGDPIMMGHWVMLLQVISLLIFIFLAVRHAAGTPAAFFAAIWMLHIRHVMQRVTGGLPRGWAGTVLAGFLYCLLIGNHKAVLLMLLLGCILHTPSTLICAVCYGLFLLWKTLIAETRNAYKKHLLRYFFLSPLFLLIVYSVVNMPPEIGTMASYKEAAALPDFQRKDPGKGILVEGRFPFVPLVEVRKEIRLFAFQAFAGRSFEAGLFWRKHIRSIAVLIFVAALLLSVWRKANLIPPELNFFLLSVAIVYTASRLLAFQLYVPDRHLQFPMAIFFVLSYSIAAWRLFSPADSSWCWKESDRLPECDGSNKQYYHDGLGVLGLLLLGALLYSSSGLGLKGSMNFNISRHAQGKIFEWIRENTPSTALFAGEPASIDPLQLFGMRRAYVTNETYHPFYSAYRDEMRRRLELTFRALYARDLAQFASILRSEGIDYFVFTKKLFYPESLRKAEYYAPFDRLINELTSGPPELYAYRQLPAVIRAPMTPELRAAHPYLAYWDKAYVLVDLRRLEEDLMQLLNK